MNKLRMVIVFMAASFFWAGSGQAQESAPPAPAEDVAPGDTGADAPADVYLPREETAIPSAPGGVNQEIPAYPFADQGSGLPAPGQEPGSGAQDFSVPSQGVPVLPTSTVAAKLDEEILIDLLELKNMDVIDVLKLVSQKSGLNIVAGNDVKGKVTIYLKNVKLADALRIILDANSLAYKYESGIIRVMSSQEFERRFGYKFGGEIQTKIIRLLHAEVTDVVTLLNQMKGPSGRIIADPKSSTIVLLDSPEKVEFMHNLIEEIDVSIETKVFELTYAPVQDVSEKIKEALTKNIGSLRFDERSKKIIVKDTPSKIQDISRMIEAFDIKRREVLIEAKIVQVDLSDSFKLGIDWKAIAQKYQQLKFEGKFTGLASTDTSWGKVTIGDYADDDYTAVIDALQTMGNAKVLSNPRISALDNEEAKIMVGTSKPYATSTTTTTASGPNTTAVTINFIDVGVKLAVTPTIHKDNFITMKIRPEVSSATKTYEAKSGTETNLIPVKESSEAETTVMVKDGHTIVIGGLIKEEKNNTESKVPLLGDIPLLGYAFRNKSDAVTRTEIVIFLTPHIISGEVEEVPFGETRQEQIDSALTSQSNL